MICCFRHDRDEEAKAFFEQAYLNDQQNLLAYQNLQNIKNKMARWHFRMLNDSARNLSFKKAIQYWIRKGGKCDVMDIGSGTGLLSMYAANVASVKSIYAIECSPIMAQISTQVLNENIRGKMVKLIMKHSIDLKDGEDIPSKVSLIVSETLDSGVFGEGILDTLIHAKEHLLQLDGKIVPWKVKIHVAGYKSKSLITNQVLLNESFQDYLFLDNFHLVAKHDEPYDAEYVNKISDFKLVTNSVEAIEVDFNDLKSMQGHFDGSIVKQFELVSDVKNDYLDGFVTWFTLFLNEMDTENVISTEPGAESCWTQAIFKLRDRILLKRDQVLKLSMSCKEGVLKIHHELDEKPEKTYQEVDPDVLRFLNDDEYLRELDYAVSQNSRTFVNGLDLSPFPFAGMMLLKDVRLEKLWCRKQVKELITFIASKNLISLDKIVFIDETELKLGATFQVIIFHPLHPLGDLNGHFLSEYSTYRKMLSDGGIMIPHKITLFGEIVNSDWLLGSCRITDVGVRRLKIDKFINEFATEVHLDLDGSVDCERLSGIFYISKIHFDNELHETSVEVPMRNINLPVHGILYHHRIQLTEGADEISTNRKSRESCFKRTAQVLVKECVIDGASIKVLFTQNSGIVKCEITNQK